MEVITHTICAFANDYNNINGGYLVIGVAADEGIPVLPPKGIANETDMELAIRNIGILMFAERPDKLIPGAQINLVRFNFKLYGEWKGIRDTGFLQITQFKRNSNKSYIEWID